MKIAVIGSGIAGLASSIRLACAGHDVTVFESNPYPGGKLTEISSSGFRFDAGPSLFTMPQYVIELFELAGLRYAEHFQFERLETLCHYFYEDGTTIQAPANRQAFIHELSSKTGEPAEHIDRALSQSAFLSDHLTSLFIEKSLNKLDTWWSPKARSAYSKLHRMQMTEKMASANKRQFQDPRLQQFFNRYATYNGSDPYQAPATLNIIAHFENHYGAFYPKGGMHSITKALAALASRKGVKFRFGESVKSLVTKNKLIDHLTTDKEKLIPFDRFVSNMDMTATYRHLLAGESAPETLLKQEKSSSALIFYWGIDRPFSELDLHNILFSADYESEFKAIWKEQTVCDDPTVYINISSKLTKTDAPEGCENWFVMINVPHNSNQDWEAIRAIAKRNILAKVKRVLKVDLEQHLVFEDYLDPIRIQARTSSWQGALYGNSSNGKLAAFFRHANQSKRWRNLYFCGGSVHPGGGIPLALSSAKIVSDLIAEA